MADTEMDIDEAPKGTKTGKEVHTQAGAVAVRSIEGWIIMVTNLHEEIGEEDLVDYFGDFGTIKNIHLNLDRRTGYAKGYVLIEFSTLEEAEAAIAGANGHKLLDNTITVDFAFVRQPQRETGKGGGGGRSGRPKGGRGRSRSPDARDERDDLR